MDDGARSLPASSRVDPVPVASGGRTCLDLEPSVRGEDHGESLEAIVNSRPDRNSCPPGSVDRRPGSLPGVLLGLLLLLAPGIPGCRISPRVSWQGDTRPPVEVSERDAGEPLPHHWKAQSTFWVSPEAGPGDDAAERHVWLRSDPEASWKLHATVNAGPAIPLDLPGEGTWGILMTPATEATPASPPASREPDAIITVDVTAPELLEFEVVPERHPGKVEVRWRARDRSFSTLPVTLEVSETGGASWRLVTRGEAEGSHLLEVPALAPDSRPPGRRVRLRIVDKMGNSTRSPELEISRMPVHSYPRLRAPEPPHTRDSRLELAYDLGPGQLEGRVEIWKHGEAPEGDRRIAVDEDGQSPVAIELKEGAHTLSLRIRREAVGPPVPSTSLVPVGSPAPPAIVNLTVDRQAPRIRLREARVVGEEPLRLRVLVEAEDVGASGLERLRFHAKPIDDESYVLLGEFEPGRIVELELEPTRGIYAIHAEAVDRAGNASPPPPGDEPHEPMARVAIGVPDFEVEIVSFASHEVLLGGSRHYIFLQRISHNAGARPASITVSYSLEGEARWIPIAESIPFTTRLPWEVPRTTAHDCRLRVVARDDDGLETAFITPRGFGIDSTPPDSRITRADDLGSGKVRLELAWGEDRPAGLESGTIYHRPVLAGVSWRALETVEKPEPTLTVELPPGQHELLLVAEDRVGNRLAPPGDSTSGQVRVRVLEVTDGALVLRNFHGGAVRGGDQRYVFWDYRGPEALLAEQPFSVDFSQDGGATWSTLEGGGELPLEVRQLSWTLPELDGQTGLLRLRARLRGGDFLEVRSARPFTIESRAPSVLLVGPPVSATSDFELSFQAWTPDSVPSTRPGPEGAESSIERDPVTVTRVEAFVARHPEGDWQLAGTWEDSRGQAEVTGNIPVSLTEGSYRVALVATDSVGNRSAPSAVPGRGGGKILVDSLRPRLRVLLGDTRDIYTRHEEVPVIIRVEDEHLPPAPVSISLISRDVEGAEDEKLLEPRFPARGTYLLTMPEASGTYTLRVKAEDIAGNASRFERVFFVMPPRPRVTFRNLQKTTYLRGGEHLEVQWDSRYVSYEGPTVSIHLSRDGGLTWSSLAEGLENSGSFLWEVPREDFQSGRLRIEVRGDRDQLASAISGPLVVSTRIPRVEITRITAPLENRVEGSPSSGVEETREEKPQVPEPHGPSTGSASTSPESRSGPDRAPGSG